MNVGDIIAVIIPTVLTLGAGLWRISAIIATLTNKVDNLADDVKEVKESQAEHVRTHRTTTVRR